MFESETHPLNEISHVVDTVEKDRNTEWPTVSQLEIALHD